MKAVALLEAAATDTVAEYGALDRVVDVEVTTMSNHGRVVMRVAGVKTREYVGKSLVVRTP